MIEFSPSWDHIEPIPFLIDLRNAVLERSLKRSPKWRFRLASDLIIELQPKACPLLTPELIRRGFTQKTFQIDGKAAMGEGADGSWLDKAPKVSVPWWTRR